MMPETMFELADRLKLLRDRKADLEGEIKQLQADIEETGNRLVHCMTETETPNFTHAGSMFVLTNKTHVSAPAGRKNVLYDALRSEGFGDLIYETVNANSLSAFVREQITESDDKLPTWLDGLVTVFEKTTVNVRKSSR